MLRCAQCNLEQVSADENGACPRCGTCLSLPPETMATLDNCGMDPNATIDLSKIGATLDLAVTDDINATVRIDATIELSTLDEKHDTSRAKPTADSRIPPNDASIDPLATMVDPAGTDKTVQLESDFIENASQQNIAMSARVTKGGTLASQLPQSLWGSPAAGAAGFPFTMSSANGSAPLGTTHAKGINPRRLTDLPDDPTADYEIMRAVGKGAMGEVFAARQVALNRIVAVKTISAQRSQNSRDQQKFLYEAQITGELDHPNIVPVHDLALRDDGSPFYSMKLVSGSQWQNELANRSRDENVDILLKVSDAIAFAHAHQIIHRDLKPENIMLGQFGEVLVMDWGLAIDLKRGERFDLAGTPAYMAPEMARHDVDKIGPTSDIYLLGAMLFQIVCGYPPHPGKTVTECVLAAANNRFNPIPDRDDPLLNIALTAMASETSSRFETVELFQRAIRDYRRHAESVAQSQRAEETLQKAIAGADYESFSRALFAFNDAVELWPENAKARHGIDRAHLAYGQCALQKSDYDLALQVLRPTFEQELPFYEQALHGKEQSLLRNARIRRLQRTLAVGGLVATIVFMCLTGWAWQEKAAAQRERDRATKLADSEKAAKEQARNNEAIAVAAKEQIEEKNETITQQYRTLDEQRNQLASSLQTQLELTEVAQSARSVAEKNRLIAEVRSLPASLALAATLIKQRDVARGIDALNDIQRLDRALVSTPVAPTTRNWVFDRIQLATNQDVPSFQMMRQGEAERISCASIAQSSGLVALGSESGQIEVIALDRAGQFVSLGIVQGNAKEADSGSLRLLQLHPRGNWLAYVMSTVAGDRILAWRLDSNEPVLLEFPNQGRVNRLDFTPDGKLLVVSLERGVRTWDVSDTQLPRGPVEVVPALRRLAVDQMSWSNTGASNEIRAFVLAAEKSSELVTIKGTTTGEIQLADVDGLTQSMTYATMLDQDRVIVGSESGALYEATTANRELKVSQQFTAGAHSTRIVQIAVARSGDTVLSVSMEPIVQMWNRNVGIWNQGLSLIGHGNEEILAAGFLKDDQLAVSVDRSGRCLLWDLPLQRKRRQLDLASGEIDGQVIYSGSSGLSGTMSSVFENGLVRNWNDSDGELLDTNGWSIAGHTPRARIIDAELSANGKTLVTSAWVDNASGHAFGSDVFAADLPESYREFCAWDLQEGKVIHRWWDGLKGIPSVAVSPGGDSAVVAMNGDPSQSLIVDFETGKMVPLIDERGKGVLADGLDISPISPHRLGTAVRGLVRAFEDRTNAGKNSLVSLGLNDQQADLEGQHRIVEVGWSADGETFLVFYNTGRIHLFDSDASGKLNLRSVLQLENTGLVQGALDWRVSKTNSAGLRLDLVSQNDAVSEWLTCELDAEATGFKISERRKLIGNHWLREVNGIVSTVAEGELEFIGFESIVRLLPTSDEDWKIAISKSGSIARVNLSDKSVAVRLGNSKCTAADSDAATQTTVTGHREGQIWVHTPQQNSSFAWTAIPSPFISIDRLAIAPSGGFLLVAGRMNHQSSEIRGLCIDLRDESKSRILELGPVHDFVWHTDNSMMAGEAGARYQFSVLSDDTKVDGGGSKVECRSFTWQANRWSQGVARPIALAEDAIPSRLGLFEERFANGSLASKWYFAIVSENRNGVGSRIDVVPVNSKSGESVANAESIRIDLPSSQLTAIAPNAKSNLLVVGDSAGNTTLWFMAPSVDQQAHELLSLEMHRGRRVTQLKFSDDGRLLVTGDAGGRHYGLPASD